MFIHILMYMNMGTFDFSHKNIYNVQKGGGGLCHGKKKEICALMTLQRRNERIRGKFMVCAIQCIFLLSDKLDICLVACIPRATAYIVRFGQTAACAPNNVESKFNFYVNISTNKYILDNICLENNLLVHIDTYTYVCNL